MVRALVLCAALLACACGKSGPQATRLQVFGDPAELEAYRALISLYEQRHPGRKLTLIPVGKQKDHMAKLATGFAAGDPPELFILNFRRFGQFAARGALEPLGPAMTASGQFRREDFYEQAVEAFEFGGALQCLPQNVSSLVVYYNRALFKQFGVEFPGKDWSIREFTDKAVKLTRDTNGDGRRDIYGAGLEPTLIRIAPFVWGMGAELVNDTHKPTHLALDRPLPMRVLSFVKQLNTRYGVVPPLAEHQAEDDEARFARGGLAMLFNSRRYTSTLRRIENLDWDVAPFPRLAIPVSALHADAYCMSRATKDKATAMDFVAFALSAEGQALITRSGRLVPSRKSVAQSPVFLDPDNPPASAQVFLDAIPTLRRTPNVAVWHEVETKADQIMEEWFYEPTLAGQVDPDAGGGEGRELLVVLRQAINPILIQAARDHADAERGK